MACTSHLPPEGKRTERVNTNKENPTMTRELFYENAYLKEFTATVLDCQPNKTGFDIVLDQTAFFPEGGG